MIRFNNLTLGYGLRTLIDSLTGEVRCGELTALVGRNGTGKSTLLRALAQLGEIHSGDIFLNGKPIGDISPAELSTLVAFVTTDKVRIANHTGGTAYIIFQYKGVTKFFFRFRGIHHDKFPGLGVASAGSKSSRLNDLQKFLPCDLFTWIIRPAAFSFSHYLKKIHVINLSLLYLTGIFTLSSVSWRFFPVPMLWDAADRRYDCYYSCYFLLQSYTEYSPSRNALRKVATVHWFDTESHNPCRYTPLF